MNLFSHITDAVKSVGEFWHDKVAPWVVNLFKSITHAEVSLIIPVAEKYAAQALPALVDAIKTGDFQKFADSQWDVIVNTANELKDNAVSVALTSVTTAVSSVIVSHPDVQEATVAAENAAGLSKANGIGGTDGGAPAAP